MTDPSRPASGRSRRRHDDERPEEELEPADKQHAALDNEADVVLDVMVRTG
jgi:hypothetical protein